MVEGMLANKNIWLDKHLYDEAEKAYYEKLAKLTASTDEHTFCKKSHEKSQQNTEQKSQTINKDCRNDTEGMFHKKVVEIESLIKDLRTEFKAVKDWCSNFDGRLKLIESAASARKPVVVEQPIQPSGSRNVIDDEEDDGVDLFGSDSESEDETAKKIKEQRLAEYAAKKSKKPTLIAKSNVIFDVKPWDDETDMKLLEAEVRKIAMDGLVWGASKLVEIAYGIKKLQISCVVEDDKVSVDYLQEMIGEIEDYVQSVDVAAFNKV